MTLAPHPWDAYGKPQPLDPEEWSCGGNRVGHMPSHTTIEACAEAIKAEIVECETERERCIEKMLDAERDADAYDERARELERGLKALDRREHPLPGQIEALS